MAEKVRGESSHVTRCKPQINYLKNFPQPIQNILNMSGVIRTNIKRGKNKSSQPYDLRHDLLSKSDKEILEMSKVIWVKNPKNGERVRKKECLICHEVAFPQGMDKHLQAHLKKVFATYITV